VPFFFVGCAIAATSPRHPDDAVQRNGLVQSVAVRHGQIRFHAAIIKLLFLLENFMVRNCAKPGMALKWAVRRG
ncbi:MAG: hypothetical protein J0H37_01515, partial [Hyphomicrobium denitrificans]|nr:hypothetical protein [Hyphomicrobium denitrificans]